MWPNSRWSRRCHSFGKINFLAIVDIDKNKDRRKQKSFADLYFLKALGTRQ